MTKADIVAEISKPIGVDKASVPTVVELLMSIIKDSLAKGEDVTLRSFGTFQIKHRDEKTGRNISKNTAVIIRALNIPSLKSADVFKFAVK